MITGIDVSHWQGLVDWHKAKAAGAEFAYFKATDGTGYVDSMLQENLDTCILPHGAYHFFHPELDAQAQAQFFMANVPELALPPAVDVEINRNNISTSVFRTRLSAFLTALEARYGVLPVIYTRKSFWDPELGRTSFAGKYPLWVAHYTTASEPYLPVDWSHWTIWQYSADKNGRGREFGCQSTDVDIDRCVPEFLSVVEPPDDIKLLDSVIAQLKHYRDKLLEGRPLA